MNKKSVDLLSSVGPLTEPVDDGGQPPVHRFEN